MKQSEIHKVFNKLIQDIYGDDSRMHEDDDSLTNKGVERDELIEPNTLDPNTVKTESTEDMMHDYIDNDIYQ